MANIKSGDEFVFQQVFEEYHTKLYYYTLGKTKSEYLAEEVTQMTFIKLWQSRERLNEDISISIQLFRIGTAESSKYIIGKSDDIIKLPAASAAIFKLE